MESVQKFKSILSNQELRLISIIAIRIADKPLKSLLDGIPKTDGENIWLPFSDESLSFNELIGLTAHESAHIRFKSIFDPGLPSSIFPQNPELSMVVLNIFEDFRVDLLLNQSYPGFWSELNSLHRKEIQILSQNLEKYPSNILETKNALNFALIITSFIQSKSENLIFNKKYQNNDGYFKFASKNLGKFWIGVNECFNLVRKHLTFSTTIIAAKIYIKHLLNLVENIKTNPFLGKTGDGTTKIDLNTSNKISINLGDLEIDKNLVSHNFPKIKPTKSDYTILKKLNQNISSGRYNHEELDDLIGNVFIDEKKEIDKILEQIKTGKREILKVEDQITEFFFENELRLSLSIYENIEILKVINNVKNPKQIYNSIVNKNQVLIKELKNNFKKLLVKNYYDRGMRKGIINNRDISRVISSKGKFNRPFKLPVIKSHVKLMIIIDESGSMLGDCDFYDGDIYVDVETTQKIPIYIAKESAIVLAESLRDTKIIFGIVGFSAVADQMQIVEKVYKNFDEKINPEKLGAIWVSDSSSENRDGTSLQRVAKRHFKNTQGGVPIMIIISDGQPWHHGTDYVDIKAKTSTSKSIKLLINQGIRIFAISLDDRGDDYLKKIYSHDNYIIVSKPEEIKDKLVYLVKNIANHIY